MVEDRESWLPVKYERLPTFCYNCGRLGHVERDCEQTDANHASQQKFGDWIRASPTKYGRKVIDKGRNSRTQPLKNTVSSQEDDKQDAEEDQKRDYHKVIPDELVSGLLNSLERIDMGAKSHLTLAAKSNLLPTINPTIPKNHFSQEFCSWALTSPSQTTCHSTKTNSPQRIVTMEFSNHNTPTAIEHPLSTPTTSTTTTTIITKATISETFTQPSHTTTPQPQAINLCDITTPLLYQATQNILPPSLPPMSTRRVRIIRERMSGESNATIASQEHREKRKEFNFANFEEQTNQKRYKIQEDKDDNDSSEPAAVVAWQPRRTQ